MLSSLRNFLRPRAARPRPAIPPGQRVYAVGDIHGRADLFAQLIEAIENDDQISNTANPAQTTIILLGDLIDRGPDSRGVLEMAARWRSKRPVRILLGNHEEMLLQSLEKVEVLRHFLRHGGRETLLSFEVDEQAYNLASFEEVQEMLHKQIPQAAVEFIRGFEDSIRIGDYLFVHAGIRPGVALEGQNVADLRWIREPFLSSVQEHGAVVVHGHTISSDPQVRPNRLGIDTGAYETGRLTALALQGEERWTIQTACQDGTIVVSTQTIAA